MTEEKLICGQCSKDITESQESYLEINNEHTGHWYQCMDCYFEQEEAFYRDDEESYADQYNRTNYNLYGEDDPNQWDEEE
tara:strand:+ start:363 stop:602 length:240 start_codon:yes stop_codon:yes gene_type:complete